MRQWRPWPLLVLLLNVVVVTLKKIQQLGLCSYILTRYLFIKCSYDVCKSKSSAPVICNYFVWMINEKKMSKGTIHTLLQTINLDNKLLSHHLMLYDFTNSVLAFPIFLNWNTTKFFTLLLMAKHFLSLFVRDFD